MRVSRRSGEILLPNCSVKNNLLPNCSMRVLLLPNCENVKKVLPFTVQQQSAGGTCNRFVMRLCFIVIAFYALHSQEGETELYTVRQAESDPHRTFGGIIFNLKKGECSGRTATKEEAPPVER